MSIGIRECGSTLLCRVDGEVSDANTKVYGDGSENFKHFFFLSFFS